MGRLAAALTPKPVISPESQATAAWRTGAIGEEQLGRILEMLDRVQVLHDRRLPGSKANIDHIVVAPGGVSVIDAKRYKGRVHQRDKGSFFRPNMRLYVGSRDCSKLVASVIHQAQVVRQVLDDEEDIAVFAALCFIDSEWSLFSRPSAIDGVWIGWPKALGKWLARDGPLDAEGIQCVTRKLAAPLKPA